MNSPRIISIDSFFLNITRGLAGQRTHRLNDLVRCILGKDGFLTRSQSLHRRTSTQPKRNHCCNHNSFHHRLTPSSCIYHPPIARADRGTLCLVRFAPPYPSPSVPQSRTSSSQSACSCLY